MNSEIKKILFDLVEYYNAMGTDKDPGIGQLMDVVQRASLALEVQSRLEKLRTSSVDPFDVGTLCESD
jgi:hypothetical protein